MKFPPLAGCFVLALLGWCASIANLVAQAPNITVQPTNQNICAGLTATLRVVASGSSPLRYQWHLNDSPVSGATNSLYSITNVQPEHAGVYMVVVTNTLGSKTSSNATLVVGTLAVWGNASSLPVPLDVTNLTAIAAGTSHVLGLRENGTVAGWGGNLNGQTNVPAGLSNVVAVAAGGNHSMALRADGTVACWGDNSRSVNIPPSVSNIVAISAGLNFNLAIQADRTPVVYGSPSGGSISTLPLGAKARALAAGSDFVVMLTEAGTALNSGGTNVPAGLSNLVAIAAGNFFTLALRGDGTVVGWGQNTSGQTTIPASATNVVAIAAGENSGFAVRADGSLVNWGNGAATTLAIPNGLTNVFQVRAGLSHAEALRNFGAPVVTVQPGNRTAWSGETVTLVSLAAGSPPPSCQWWWNGVPISDATNTALTFASLQQTNAGGYALVFSNAFGVVTSQVATVTVRQRMSIGAWGNSGSGQCFAPEGLTNAVTLSGGDSHTLALKDDGTVVGWGASGGYQAQKPADLTNVFAIAAGARHNLALKADGTVRAWGSASSSLLTNSSTYTSTRYVAIAAGNGYSLLVRAADGGLNSVTDSLPETPGFPPVISGVKAVAVRGRHALALKSDGTVIAWGNNFFGQTNVPAGLLNVTAIACGDYHSLALRQDGTVFAWGNNAYGQTNLPAGLSNIVAIAAGQNYNLALGQDGTVIGWGEDTFGQSTTPAPLTNALTLAAGGMHSLALVGDSEPCVTLPPRGLTMPFGTNPKLQAAASGTPPLNCQWLFEGAPIAGATNLSLTLSNFQVSQAGNYAVAVTNVSVSVTSAWAAVTPGPIAGWGDNGVYQAVAPAGLTNPVAVAGGVFHSLALKSDGTIAWGNQWWPVPTGLTGVAAIAAGWYTDVAAFSNGTVVAWGVGANGQTNVPAGLSNVVALAAGDYHVLALQRDDRVVGWGTPPAFLDYGQANPPAHLTNISAIAAGESHSLALRNNGTVFAWGYNISGQTNVPAGLSNVVAIAAAYHHSLALKVDGTVVPWGAGSYGLNSVPASATNVIAIGCAGFNNIAVKSDGACVVWGDSSLEKTTLPAGLPKVVAAAGGLGHILVLTGDGRPYITVHPFNRTVFAASTISFNVVAAGDATLSYQWRFNNSDLAGATGNSLTLTNVALGRAGEYTCVVSNSLGTTTSLPGKLTVLRPPLLFDAAAGAQLTNDMIKLRLTGFSESGPIVLYASTNLVDWEAIFTNPPVLGAWEYFDPLTNAPLRFYRVSETW